MCTTKIYHALSCAISRHLIHWSGESSFARDKTQILWIYNVECLSFTYLRQVYVLSLLRFLNNRVALPCMLTVKAEPWTTISTQPCTLLLNLVLIKDVAPAHILNTVGFLTIEFDYKTAVLTSIKNVYAGVMSSEKTTPWNDHNNSTTLMVSATANQIHAVSPKVLTSKQISTHSIRGFN